MYPIPCFYIVNSSKPIAESVNLASLGICLKGGKAQLLWDVTPEGADLHDIMFVSDSSTIASVTDEGLVSFLNEGDFNITMTAKTGTGEKEKTLTSKINAHIDELRIEADQIGNRSVGDRFWFVYKGDPSFDPSNPSPNMVGFDVFPPEIMEEDDFSIYGFAETPNIISMAPSGIFTCISSGEAQCGLKGTYKDVSTTHKETVTVV